ncbi:MAG: aminotransferase class III-fold pyridoxal phosphate-dependent enzyme [Candidatus Heimdallarchaeota archaeon]
MASKDLEQVKNEIIARYEAKTPSSKKHFNKAQKWLPGGGTRNIAYFYPYPFYITKGEGCYLEDVDGNRYIDILNNMTVLIHGHAHPKMVEKIEEQLRKGTAHAAPMEVQYELAKIICERTPSVEELRFCNSGTEATMFAIRAARYYTKKNKIIKIDGGYHGSHDYVEVNINSDLFSEGNPVPTVEKGVPETLLKDVFVVPYNDLEAAEMIMKKHHKEIAAMILEPLMGSAGGIVATTEYLKGLRKLTTKYDILLIFDEVITYRLTTGGMQKLVGVTPDLTAFGKTIGGGFPIGAFGGKRELIEQFNPMNKNFITHSGTFSGNAMTMVAGKIALELYDEAEVKRLTQLGKRLQKGLKSAMDSLGVICSVGCMQSLVYVHLTEESPVNAKQLSFDTIPYLELGKYLQIALVINGLYTVSRGVTAFILSTPMDEKIIDEIVERFKKSMEMVLPIYEDVRQYDGFAAIIYVMLKSLNLKKEFASKFKEDNYSLLLVAKDDPFAMKVSFIEGKVFFTQIENSPAKIKAQKKECDGSIITTKPTFLGFGLGKINPVKAIITGKLKIRGIRYILKFSKYFELLK